MDKRSLFFVFSLSITLFLTNLYFSHESDLKRKEWLDAHEKKQSALISEKQAFIEKRLVSKKDLPLFELFADNGASQYLSSGLLVNEAIITVGWSDKTPEEVYYRPLNSLEPLKKATRAAVPSEEALLGLKGQPLIYQTTPNAKLGVLDWPILGVYDIQLLHFTNESESPVTLSLGELNNSQFVSYEEILDVKNPPVTLAIMPLEDKWYPIGLVRGVTRNLHDLEDSGALLPWLQKVDYDLTTSKSEGKEEAFYVLENDVIQLVISTKGGAVSEINLPFEGDSNPRSVVKPINVDRTLSNQDRSDSHFPSRPYWKSSSDGPQLVKSGKIGGFYPLLRRGIKTKDGHWDQIPPEFTGFNIVSEFPDVSTLIYEVKEFSKEKLVLEAKQKHRKILKTFTLAQEGDKSLYNFQLDLAIEGDTRGLFLTSGVPEAEIVAGGPAPQIKIRTTKGGKTSVEALDLPQTATNLSTIYPDWVCNSNGFFGVITDPLNVDVKGLRIIRVPGLTAPSRLTLLAKDYPEFETQDLPGYETLLPLDQINSLSLRVFAGPFDTKILETVDAAYKDPKTGETPDYLASQSFHGWFAFISEPFADFLFFLMRIFYSLTGSWGLSIIFITVVLRILLYPLNTWSLKSMLAMRELAPKIQEIQEKYKNNKEKSQQAIMELYKERGVNPLSGCIPILIQIPFLIGMFDLLKSSFELRGASFIPGWIDNLAAPDVIFSWNYSLPIIGNQLHLLPLILGVVMWFQSRMNAVNKPVELMTDQERQQGAMATIMAVVFTLMFYNFPSGLNLYWLSSMLLAIAQQMWMGKKTAAK
jgi:membrane protein insertase, YidC/Oxa1 family, C-terminal domain